MARKGRAGGWILAQLGVLCIRFLGLLPLSWSRGLVRALGKPVWRFVPKLRRIGRENLDLAYGESLSDAEKNRILVEAFDNLCLLAAEIPHLGRVARGGIESMVRFHGVERVTPGQGAVVVGAHYANWEWVAPSYAAQGNKIAGIARALNHPRLDRLVNGLRSASGFDILYKEQAAREAIGLLREGWAIGLLADQAPRDNAVPVTFFGQPCWATAAPVLLALRARVPIYMIHVHRAADGRYDVTVEPPLHLTRSGDALEDLRTHTQQVQDVMERWVREDPGQWLWFHRRWKERPALAQEWEARSAKRRGRNAAHTGDDDVASTG